MTRPKQRPLFTLFMALGLLLYLLPETAQAERVVRKFKLDGLNRSYVVHLPDNPDSKEAWPVLMAWHPGGANARWMEFSAGFHKLRDARKYVVVYPEGYRLTFNAGNCCGQAWEKGIDDIAYFKAMMKDLNQLIPVQKKIYTTGFSNGGMMSFRLACELPDMVAAAAPYGGVSPMTNCASGARSSVMYFAGEHDRDSIDGGDSKLTSRLSGRRYKLPHARTTMDLIARARGCSTNSIGTRRVSAIDSNCITYNGCNGAEVMMCEIPNLGHRWPGSREPRLKIGAAKNDFGPFRPELSGARAVVEFFNRH